MIGQVDQLVAFRLDAQHYALHLGSVLRVVPVVEVTRLPAAPEVVLGVINLHGKIVPVLDLRRRFGLPKRELSLSDQLVVARTAKRTVALLVDSVSGVVERPPQEITGAGMILPGLEYLGGVAKLQDGMLLIHDLDTFLSLDEEEQMEGAMTET
jgi:purine-binding chemotaxis protein CheW